MSNNKFLDSGSINNTNGSQNLYGSSIGATNLIDNVPVKADANGVLFSTSLNSTTDINFTDVDISGSYSIGGTEVLNAGSLGSGIASSSLTSLGTLNELRINNEASIVSFGTLDNFIYVNAIDGVLSNTNSTIAASTVYNVIDSNNNGFGQFRITKGSTSQANMDSVFNSNPFFIVDNIGNIGMGKTTPTSPLDVAGAVNMDSSLTVGGAIRGASFSNGGSDGFGGHIINLLGQLSNAGSNIGQYFAFTGDYSSSGNFGYLAPYDITFTRFAARSINSSTCDITLLERDTSGAIINTLVVALSATNYLNTSISLTIGAGNYLTVLVSAGSFTDGGNITLLGKVD